jgi:hypothetical protein
LFGITFFLATEYFLIHIQRIPAQKIDVIDSSNSVFWSTKSKKDIKKEQRDAELLVREDNLTLEKVSDENENTAATKLIMQDKGRHMR